MKNNAMVIVGVQVKGVKATILAMYSTTDDHELTAKILQRPWYIWWLMGQVYR
jgi:hypothetical protein